MKAHILASFIVAVTLQTSCGNKPSMSELENNKKSDLQRDLAGPLGDRGTPFKVKKSDRALPKSLKEDLKKLSDRCFIQKTILRSDGSVGRLERVTNLCPNEVSTVQIDTTKMTEIVTFTVAGESYSAVTFDGLYSDRGDIGDIAVYNGAGKRIAVETNIFGSELGILLSLADFAGADVKQVRVQQ